MGLILGSAISGGSGGGTNLLASNPLTSPGVAGALSSASAAGTNYPVNTPLPSWLSTNTSSEIGELEDTYKSAPASILSQASDAATKANEGADEAYGQSMRQGANATLQLANSQRQQGGTAKTSSIVAGEMAEDAQKNRTDARVQIAQMQLGATEQAASLSSQIASSIGSLRTSYLNTLATVNDSQRGQDMQYSENSLNYALQAAKTATPSSGSGSTAPSTPTEYYTGPNGAGVGAWAGPMGFGAAPVAGQNIYPGWG